MNTDRIKVLSRCQDNVMGVSLALRALKLQEETGEVAAAVLCNLGAGNKSASAKNNVAEEVVDVIINGFDILYALGVSDSDIQELLDTKLGKWKRKLEALS
jgi:NTP pyrophosphatase (non-canonical NTP hydrolase)